MSGVVKLLAAGCAAALLALGGQAQAQASTSKGVFAYVGLDGGVTRTRTLDNTVGSVGLYAGWLVSDRFALEAGWRRVGQDPRADIATVSLLARAELTRNWSLYGRLGVGRLSSDIPNGRDAGGTRPVLGLGLHGVLGPKLAMRVDLQQVGSGTRHLGAGLMWAF